MGKFPRSKQGKLAIPGVSGYRKGPLWLNLAMLLLTGIIVSACGSTSSQQKASPQPTKAPQVAATMVPQPTPAPPGHLAVFIPAYWDNTSSNWARLIKTHPQETTVIVNLNDGPVDSFEPALAKDITDAHKAGIKIIGYVWTGEANPTPDAPGGQPEATVKYNIDLWYKYYKMDGVLLDDVLYKQKNIPYFQDLYHYIKQKYGSNSMVFINGAAIPPASFAPVADVIQIYEGTLASNAHLNYEGYQQDNFIQKNQSIIDGWMSEPANATKFASIVSDIHTTDEMKTVIQTSIKAHIHYVDAIPTDQSYTDLPPYWEQFVSLIENTPVPATN
jgi:hypothetical protein